MVNVTTSVELDLLGKSNRLFDFSLGVEFGLLFKEVVQVVNIGSVMLAVMELKQVA